MAGNKMNTKTKGKEEKSKTSAKVNDQNNEEAENPDFSLLRKPILTSVTGFGQARKIFDFATEELKTLLSDECDILYECKVCRNIFRSLANLISHKRVYCKEKFNSTIHGHFIKTTSTINELFKIKQNEKSYQESLSENNLEYIDTDDERVPLSKDLTDIIEKITKKRKLYSKTKEPTVITEMIPSSSVAVFQNIDSKPQHYDNMRLQVKELHQILSRDTGVLQDDGRFKVQSALRQEPDNVIQISDDDDNDCPRNNLKCKICDMQFSTLKTLKFHTSYKHKESRIVYPCPDCLDIFSTAWSVYRHLYKVHRKTTAQIRKLRESIQSKAFRKNNPPASYEKRKNNIKIAATQKISEEERLDQENQAWMDNMEGDGEVPRCGGCGRSFERRAALAAHTHTCVPRTRALAAVRLPRRQEHKRIQIQIRKDYLKEPVHAPIPISTISSVPVRSAEVNGIIHNEVTIPDSPNDGEDVSDKQKNDALETADGSEDEPSSGEVESSPEKMECSIVENAPTPIIRLPLAQQAEKRNLAALRVKIQPDIDLDKMLCIKCQTHCNTIQELYDHTAAHYKWLRYACKLCNYKHYKFEKLPEHVKVVHKLKGEKDFYFSTVKAIDGPEALELSENIEDMKETYDNSPDSRRPSRCSSDSSRLSDDSSSSSTRVEGGSRKRKPQPTKVYSKKRKESITKNHEVLKDGSTILFKERDNDSSSNIKAFEENSSDMDDVDDKISKRLVVDTSSVASRRPIRRKAKPKNADFEYDLSNLLKMEAQGYRESQPNTTAKTYQIKKRIYQDVQVNFENLNKDCCGALVSLSRKAVEKSAAHIKVNSFVDYSQRDNFTNVFVRPMVPKSINKGDKSSPKKDLEDKKDSPSSNKQQIVEVKLGTLNLKVENKLDKSQKVEDKLDTPNLKLEDKLDTPSLNVEDKLANTSQKIEDKLDIPTLKVEEKFDTSSLKVADKIDMPKPSSKEHQNNKMNEETSIAIPKEDLCTVKHFNNTLNKNPAESNKTMHEIIKANLNIPTVGPLKLRRQSMEVIKNPLINKNIKDLTKVGMKTKILVIKPINRNQDGSKGSLATPLKFQTITLKDPNKSSSCGDKSSDQVVVVKVPKVECAVPKAIVESAITTKTIIAHTSNMEPLETNNQSKATDPKKSDPAICETVVIDENCIEPSENNSIHEIRHFQNNSECILVEENNLGNQKMGTDKNDNVDSSVKLT